MSKRKTTNYSLEFKQSSAQLAVNSDQSVSKTAKELGVNANTLHGWVKRFQPTTDKLKQQHPVEHNTSTEELKQLKKENARLRQERDILKKAAAYFAGETL